jgi:hypothetical protein
MCFSSCHRLRHQILNGIGLTDVFMRIKNKYRHINIRSSKQSTMEILLVYLKFAGDSYWKSFYFIHSHFLFTPGWLFPLLWNKGITLRNGQVEVLQDSIH